MRSGMEGRAGEEGKEEDIPHKVFTSSTWNSNPALLIDMTAF
jgi:hypothetical protein